MMRTSLEIVGIAVLTSLTACGQFESQCNFIDNAPRVTVLDKTSMAPLCDASVTVSSSTAGPFVLNAFSDPNGGCLFLGDLRSGDVQVVVSRSGFRDQTVDTTIQVDSCGHPHDDVTVVLEPQ